MTRKRAEKRKWPDYDPDRPRERSADHQVEFGLAVIADWVADGRRRVGWSQSVLESYSGVDQTVISRLERGVMTSLGIARLAAIIGALAGQGLETRRVARRRDADRIEMWLRR